MHYDLTKHGALVERKALEVQTEYMLKKDQDSHQEKKKGIFHQVVERFSSFRRSTTDGDTAD
ncbi:MAG: hypothetical protein ABUK17_11260, partial [Syntrophobacteria bacterium]